MDHIRRTSGPLDYRRSPKPYGFALVYFDGAAGHDIMQHFESVEAARAHRDTLLDRDEIGGIFLVAIIEITDYVWEEDHASR